MSNDDETRIQPYGVYPMPELTIARRGLMMVLSSPSGAGKTTMSRELLKHDNNLVMSVSATTRPPRAGEQDGSDYFFIGMSPPI